tara:strand:- start:3517 stop:4773 length:1257 start_codon:yes stop_codon:yes gene_type:complete
MSQKQVSLKSGNQFTQAIVGSVDKITSTMKALGDAQAKKRAASNRAILNGNQTTAEFMKTYGRKIQSSNSEFNTKLNNYVREQAELIGNARAKAESPDATQEDRSNYLTALQTGEQNLQAIATMSVVVEKDKKALLLDQQARQTKSSKDRITNHAKLNSGFIGFESALLSSTAQDIQFSTAENGGVVISLTDVDGNPQSLNVADFNQTLQQTGETIATSVIADEDLLSGAKGKAWLEETKNWADVKAIPFDITGLSEQVEMEGLGEEEKLTITAKRVAKTQKNLADTIYNNHQDWLDSKINFNFGKTWDQFSLLGDKFITDENLRNISWETLHNPDPEKGVEQIKRELLAAGYDENDIKLDMDANDDNKFDVNDYLELQKQMDEEGRRAMSTFMAEKLRVDKTLKVDANITAPLNKKE